MNLGKTINDLRKKNNLTQEDLANKLGVSPQAVSKWENDLSCPDISLLPEIAGIFGISVDELLGGVYKENTDSDSEEQTQIKAVRKINISVDNHGKVTNVSLPIKLLNFGLNIGSAFVGITDEQSKTIMNAVQNGLSGEILHVNGENGEDVTISLE